jgi:eukaryotic-like serine/threonine-protein kinase
VEPPKNTPETAPTDPPDSGTPATPGVDAAARTELQEAGATRRDSWLGRVLDDRYRITERLGEGGMGAVFVAEHLKLRKQVALKMIRAELAGNGEVAARFAREAMTIAQFEHPHVASAIDYGTLPEGGAYLVMQLVRGQSLRDLLERGRLPWPTACELLAQVADALSAARGAGIVHRDLKPDNILVETREDGSQLAKILDFGIAHVAPHAQASGTLNRELTRVGTVMGTPGYMSPEQAVGDKVDHRTDLYALGVVLWECLTGRTLWDGPDITSIIARQMRDDVPRLRDVAPELRVPRELDELIQRLCAREVSARPDHAGAVRDQLRALAHTRAVGSGALRTRELHDAWSSARRWLGALPSRTRQLAALGAVAVLLGTLVLLRGAGDPSQKPAADGGAAHASDQPRATEDDPGIMQKAVQVARGMIDSGKKGKPPIPPELAADVQTMRESARSAERRKAAIRVLAYKGSSPLPAWVAAIAKLEEARTCRERKDAIALLATLGDKRGLPALRRLNDAGRTGCGFLNLEDCYGCVRVELRRAVTTLEEKSAN